MNYKRKEAFQRDESIQTIEYKIKKSNAVSDSLKKELEFFLSFIDKNQRIKDLTSIKNLYSNPDREIKVYGHGGWFEILSLKNIITAVLENFCPRFSFKSIKKFKKKNSKKKLKAEKKNYFKINTADIKIDKIPKFKRKNTKFNHSLFSNTKLKRILRYTTKKNSNKISLLPTIKNAVKNGNYNLKNQAFKISKSDFLYPQSTNEELINLMLVLDSSKSISWFIQYIEMFLPIISAYSFKNRDKIGYITYMNNAPQIVHYPTLNVQQVIGSINKTKIGGETPLADGLNLARQVFRKQQYNQPGIKNMVLLISDCFPEPLEGGYKNIFDEPAYKKFEPAVRQLKEDKVEIVIVNPADLGNKEYNWGHKLAKKMEKKYKIKYLEINKPQTINILKSEVKIMEQELNDLAREVMRIELS